MTKTYRTSITSASPAETQETARKLVETLPKKAVLALHGEMGSGKTCFAQGIALALGIKSPVTSPTFTLIGEYKGTRRLYHIDLYRLRDSDEALALGLEEYLDPDGITAIEWAERAEDLLPANTIHIYFETTKDPDKRKILIITQNNISIQKE